MWLAMGQGRFEEMRKYDAYFEWEKFYEMSSVVLIFSVFRSRYIVSVVELFWKFHKSDFSDVYETTSLASGWFRKFLRGV